MSTETATIDESPVEGIKRRSHFLRGGIAQGLLDPVTGALAVDDTHVLKFHGSYQQDDRDIRDERRRQKLEPAHSFMIRARVPGGVCTPAQWLAFDALATRHANGSLRLTTRQTFQLHGIVKRELKATIAAMHAVLVDSIAACGDVNRNVLASANPVDGAAHAEVQSWARRLSEHLLPRTRAYHEIWLDGEKVAGGEHEPIYGPTYLPRKFKAAIAVPPFNDVDVFAHDLGFIAILDAGRLVGFNLTAGGGMGATHGEASTYPRLADVIGFLAPQDLIAIAEAVVTTQRDHGDRSDRKRARLKYTIADRGLDWFRAEVERRSGVTLAAPRPFLFTTNGDRFGWIEGSDGCAHLTLRIESGRIADRGEFRALTGLRELARIHTGDLRMTPNQNLIVANVAPAQRARIDALVTEHGLDLYRTAKPLRLNALACVALPTCPLAMAEAERYLPELVARIGSLLAQHGLADEPIGLRVTGCPNGCARPYLAEIGLIGKGPGRYNLQLGGDARGERLNVPYRDNVAEPEILAALDALFAAFARERTAGEAFGDYLVRSGVVVSRAIPIEVRS